MLKVSSRILKLLPLSDQRHCKVAADGLLAYLDGPFPASQAASLRPPTIRPFERRAQIPDHGPLQSKGSECSLLKWLAGNHGRTARRSPTDSQEWTAAEALAGAAVRCS